MYNLTEYNKNYSKESGSLWKYNRDETISGTEGNVDYSIKYSKTFDYKTSNAGRLEGGNTEKNIKIVVPLKHLRNFWRTLNITLINCELPLTLTWS